MKRPERNEYFDSESKVFGVFARLAAGVSVSTILFSFSMMLGLPITLGTAAGCLLIGMPSTYIGLTKLREKIHNEYIKDMHMYEQLMRGLEDFKEMDANDIFVVKENTAVFYDVITRKDVNNKIPESEYNNINAFLFMVNENYFDKIAVGSYKTLSRNTLAEMMMSIILSEFNPEEESFDEFVAEDVINRAFFINKETKEEMIAEFFNSKSRMLKETTFKIVSNRLSVKEIEDGLNNPKNSEDFFSAFDQGFNIKKTKHYQLILEDLNEHESNTYGNFFDVEWDFKLFKEVICMIDELYGEQLEELYDDFSMEGLAATLLHNVAIYCVLNKKASAGMQEILNAMREWHYIDYDDKLVIIESIYREFTKMEDIIHPFTGSTFTPSDDEELKEYEDDYEEEEEKVTERPQCKIIEFPKNKN